MKGKIDWKNAGITVVAIAVCTWLAQMIGCLEPSNSNVKISVTADTSIIAKFDSIPVHITGKNLVAAALHDTVFYPVSVSQVIDTLEIIKQFFSCVTSTYHYRKENLYDLIINDSQCQNKLLSRNIDLKILRPDSLIVVTNTVTRTVTNDKARIYAGVSGSLINPFSPGIVYAHEKFAATVHYSPFQNQVEAGLYIKIR
jgi:hypothetical protein